MVAIENVLVWADRVLLPIINADRSVSSLNFFLFCFYPRT